MIRRPPRSTLSSSSAASDVYKRQDLSIQMDKKEIAKVALTGKFRISDGLDYALRVLQNDVAFTYQRNRDNDVIHIK